MMEDNKKVCGCGQEKKEFCVIFVIKNTEERHVIITAKNAQEAIDTFRQIERVLFALCSNPHSKLVPNPADVMVVRVFENEV